MMAVILNRRILTNHKMNQIKTRVGAFESTLEIVTKSPLVFLWNAILFCGGGVLLFYHASIEFLPDFSLPDLAGLLASITLVGLFLVLFLTGACLLPGGFLAWLDSVQSTEGPSPNRSFQPRTYGLVLLLFPAIWWAFVLCLPSGLELISRRYENEYLNYEVLLLVCASAFAPWLISKRRESEEANCRRPAAWQTWLRQSFGLFVWTILFFIPLNTVLTLAQSGEKSHQWLVLGMGIMLFLVLNVTAYLTDMRDWPGLLGVAGLTVVFVLPMVAGRPLIWPTVIVRTLSLGERNAVEVVLSDKQCQALVKFGAVCPPAKSDGGQLSLRNVNVLSRVGTTLLVEALVDSAVPNYRDSSKSTLRTVEQNLYCRSRVKGGPSELCDACDRFTALDEQPIAKVLKQTAVEETTVSYRDRLVCVRLAIPKDQVLSISWSGNRSYRGFTTYSFARQ